MHRTFLPKILILLLYAVLPAAGQAKASGEVDPTKCWAYPTGEVTSKVLAYDGTRIFLGLEGAKIEALSLDGKKTWSSDLGGEIRSNILPGASWLFLVTATSNAAKPADYILRSLSTETGITAWTQKLSAGEEYFLSSSNGSVVIVSKNGVIEAIDPKDGASKWKREIAEKFVAEPVFDNGKVTVATASSQVFVVSLATGEIASMRKTSFGVTALGQTSDGKTIVGDERGNVTLFTSGTDKPYWKFKSGGEISQVTEAGDNVLAVSNDNFVYLLTGRNGSVIWKKRMPGRVSAAFVYNSKYVVLSGFEEHTAVLLDLSKGKVAGQILLGSDETATAVQPSASAILVLTDQAGYAFSLNGCSK